MQKITTEEFIVTLRSLLSIEESLSEDTDLSLYIRDSIDLGELIAVIKEKYGIEPSNLQLFKTHVRLGEVVQIFNHELS